MTASEQYTYAYREVLGRIPGPSWSDLADRRARFIAGDLADDDDEPTLHPAPLFAWAEHDGDREREVVRYLIGWELVTFAGYKWLAACLRDPDIFREMVTREDPRTAEALDWWQALPWDERGVRRRLTVGTVANDVGVVALCSAPFIDGTLASPQLPEGHLAEVFWTWHHEMVALMRWDRETCGGRQITLPL